jgi:hypothetical protein
MEFAVPRRVWHASRDRRRQHMTTAAIHITVDRRRLAVNVL